MLCRVPQQQVTLVLVAPVWKSQSWYSILLDILVDFPILTPHKEDLIIPVHPEGVLAVLPPIATWLISGTELLLPSWRQKSSKSYDSLFGKWVDW